MAARLCPRLPLSHQDVVDDEFCHPHRTDAGACEILPHQVSSGAHTEYAGLAHECVVTAYVIGFLCVTQDPVDLTTGAWQMSRVPPVAGQTKKREDLTLKNAKGAQYRGIPEAEKAGYFALFKTPNRREFLVMPIEWWYTFKKERRDAGGTLEEAEQALRDRQKHAESVAKRDLRKTSLFVEDPEPCRERGKRGGAKFKRAKAVDEVLGDELEMEFDNLMETDEQGAEGWDHEEAIADDDIAVDVDASAEKEDNDSEEKRLDAEMLEEARAKKREGIEVLDDDDEMPDYDDADAIQQRLAEQRDQRLEQVALRNRLKAAGLDDDSSDDESPEPGVATTVPGAPDATRPPEAAPAPVMAPAPVVVAAPPPSKRPLASGGGKKAKRQKAESAPEASVGTLSMND